MLVTKKELEYYHPEQVDVEYERRKKIYEEGKRNRKKAQSMRKLRGLGVAMIGLVLSLFILKGYVNITNMRHEITELENQKLDLEREKEDLLGELEGIKSPIKVEQEALTKLGMDYAKEEQIINIDVKELSFDDDMVDKSPIVQRFKDVFNLLVGLF